MRSGSRPNIVVLFADDHRYGSVGIHGNSDVSTPHLDELGSRGTVFDQAYCQGGMHGAICVPSRASLMTGHNIFASTSDPTGRDSTASMTIPPRLPTFPQLLREAGYRTHAIGKWHNDAASFTRSFDGGDQLMFGGMSDHDRVPVRPFDATGAYPDDVVEPADGFSTDLFANAAIEFINGQNGRDPFCLYVAFTSPHDPRTPPEEWRYDPREIGLPPNYMPVHPFDSGEMHGRDERLEAWPREPDAIRQHIADYYGMISHMDDRIGQILATLEARGLAENTIVVYSADHGIALGQHGLMGKQNLYDHSTHVPLIIAGPHIEAGRRVADLVWHGDTTATLLELAACDTSAASDGRSLVPMLRGGSLEKRRQYVGAAYRFTQRSVRDDRWKLIRYQENPDCEDGGPHTRGSDTMQLFDLATDPWERVNMAWDHGLNDVRTRLEEALAAWQREVSDPVHAPEQAVH